MLIVFELHASTGVFGVDLKCGPSKRYKYNINKWRQAQQISPRIPLQGAATWRI